MVKQYKKGDLVRVKTWEQLYERRYIIGSSENSIAFGDRNLCFIRGMEPLCGRIFIASPSPSKVRGEQELRRFSLSGNTYIITNFMVEPVETRYPTNRK